MVQYSSLETTNHRLRGANSPANGAAAPANGAATQATPAQPPTQPPPPPPYTPGAFQVIQTPLPGTYIVPAPVPPAAGPIILPPPTTAILSGPTPATIVPVGPSVPIIHQVVQQVVTQPPAGLPYEATCILLSHGFQSNGTIKWARCTAYLDNPPPLNPSDFGIISWSLSSSLPNPAARLTTILDILPSVNKKMLPAVIFLQDVHREAIPALLAHRNVHNAYYVTGTDTSQWYDTGAKAGLMALVRKDLKPKNVFRAQQKAALPDGKKPEALFIDFVIPPTGENAIYSDPVKRTVRFGTTWFDGSLDVAIRQERMKIWGEFVPGDDTVGGVFIGEVGEGIVATEGLRDAFLVKGKAGDRSGDTYGFQSTFAVWSRERRQRAFFGGVVRFEEGGCFGRVCGDTEGAGMMRAKMPDGSWASENCGVYFGGDAGYGR